VLADEVDTAWCQHRKSLAVIAKMLGEDLIDVGSLIGVHSA
jgi:hypothetical protein